MGPNRSCFQLTARRVSALNIIQELLNISAATVMFSQEKRGWAVRSFCPPPQQVANLRGKPEEMQK